MAESPEFFCNLAALNSEQRQRHKSLGAALRPSVTRFAELPDGYAAYLETSEVRKADIQEFLVLEKLCCPFFTLALDIENCDEQQKQMYVVRITGPGDIKPFIRAEFGIPQTA